MEDNNPKLKSFDWSPDVVSATRSMTLADFQSTLPEITTNKQTRNKFGELVVRDTETLQIQGYYDPKTLSPEYAKPRFIQVSWTTKFPMINGIPFWERIPNEVEDFYLAFCHYRDQLTPRLLSKTAQHFNIDPEILELTSQLWMWQDRVQEYDTYIAEYTKSMRSKEITLMETRHQKLAKKMLDLSEEAIEQFDIDELSPAQLVAFLKAATDLERISLGLTADGKDNKKDSSNTDTGINLSGENQKVQIIQTKDWNPG